MDVSESIPTEKELFPSTGSKKEAVIELVVDCCRITAGEGIGEERRTREGQLQLQLLLRQF